MQAEEVVNQFCAAFSAGDLDGAMRYVADDCVYHNIPLEHVTDIVTVGTNASSSRSAPCDDSAATIAQDCVPGQ